MKTIGDIFKESRKIKNITVNKVSSELKISSEIINQIENNQVLVDKDIVFFIGHIRSYSDYLNLNSDEIIKKFKHDNLLTKKEKLENLPKINFDNKTVNIGKYFSLILIFIIFFTFYNLFVSEDKKNIEYALIPDLPENYLPIIEKESLNNLNKKKIKNNTTSQIDEYSISSVIASVPDKTEENIDLITLKFLNSTWLQLRDESDNIILSKLMDKNESFSYNINLNYNITAGNAGNIVVLINNIVRGKLGKHGEILDSVVIDSSFNK